MSRLSSVLIPPLEAEPLPTVGSIQTYIQRGSTAFWRVTLALFAAGFATFALLYCVQPILPILSHDFAISPATSSLSLSCATAMLALGLLVSGPLSDAFGRKNVMVTALLLASLCTLISTRMQSWHGILLLRMLMGLSLSGVAAVAMSYLAEEIHPSHVAFAMGLYISGNSIGGMSGRLICGVLTDFYGWRFALTAIGCCALASALLFWKILPASRHFRPMSLRPRSLLVSLHLHWRDAALPWLFVEGFLLMGAFVTLFNYIGYRLICLAFPTLRNVRIFISQAEREDTGTVLLTSDQKNFGIHADNQTVLQIRRSQLHTTNFYYRDRLRQDIPVVFHFFLGAGRESRYQNSVGIPVSLEIISFCTV